MARTAATNRVATQNVNCSLSLRAANSVVDCGTDCIGTGNVTVMGWMKPLGVGDASALCRLFYNTAFNLIFNSDTKLIGIGSNGVGVLVYSSAGSVRFNNWYHVAVTRLASGSATIYINNTANGSGDSLTPAAASTNLFMGNISTGIRNFNGLLKNFAIVPRICTQSEIQAHMNGTNPSDATRIFKMDEGAGTVLYDTSTNAVNGTITAGTYVIDTPTKVRKLVSGNMVYNGDFEFAPPTNVTHGTNQSWIDGTAGGSTTNRLFGWAVSNGSDGQHANVIFDNTVSHSGRYSLKTTIDGTIGGGIEINNFISSSTLLTAWYMPCLPSTSYTLTGWMKTQHIGGDIETGNMSIGYYQYNGVKTLVAQSSIQTIHDTTDWTLYTKTFTTNATARFITVKFSNNTSTDSNNIAWFDDITLTPTTPITRTLSPSRTLVS